MTTPDLAHRFAFHPATTAEKRDTHTSMRQACHQAAQAIDEQAPHSREKSLALTKLEEAMMWANAAVARYGDDTPPAAAEAGVAAKAPTPMYLAAQDGIRLDIPSAGLYQQIESDYFGGDGSDTITVKASEATGPADLSLLDEVLGSIKEHGMSKYGPMKIAKIM